VVSPSSHTIAMISNSASVNLGSDDGLMMIPLR
jgi:hypothetical protein